MTLVWGAGDWLLIAAGMGAGVLGLLLVGYWRSGASLPVRLTAAGLKTAGVILLALCLLEPLTSQRLAKPGANQFILLADNSQSMTLRADRGQQTRGEQFAELVPRDARWLARLGGDFDLRQFAFDTQLRSVPELAALTFDGRASDLGAALDRLLRRYHGRPLAGILLFTDGSITDGDVLERVLARSLAESASAGAEAPPLRVPPIYPVLIGGRIPAKDVSIERVAVTQTNFEDAPVTLTAQIVALGARGQSVDVELLDESGESLEKQNLSAQAQDESRPLVARFNIKPQQPGVSFYRVRAGFVGLAQQDELIEATLVNNSRLVAVDRGSGPYRVLYVAGRPNWEFKFLNRAVESDKQVELVGYIRIAKREPKFNFLGRLGDPTNPLFRGFDNVDPELVETYDKPVIMRLGTVDENELQGGFPATAEELFKYHAVILDDVEAEFFSQDQMLLLKEFVRTRGGGLLMLGGQETFRNGKFDRTSIGDLLPVYVDQVAPLPADARFRMTLTREGWLEPWVRLRSEEDLDRQRLEQMPDFRTLNPVRGIKPGATVLARAQVQGASTSVPALVEQRFGHGRVAALLIGDLWRWDMQRPANTESELGKAWRQTVRWLVAEVPKRVEIIAEARGDPQEAQGAVCLTVTLRDEAYGPLHNAAVKIRVTAPDEGVVELRAEPGESPGAYEAIYVPRLSGAYRAVALAGAPDGADLGSAATGWTSDPAAEEFRVLQPNLAQLEKIARATGGQILEPSNLERFAASLPAREAPVMEARTRPFWHHPLVFLVAIGLLAAEWGLRRWKGLP